MARSLADLLSTRVPGAYRARLELVGVLARELSVRVHIVGGTTRDLLLNRPLGDLDLLVEGDAEPLARALAGRLGCEWRAHPGFGTAEVLDPTIRTDLAAARTETYVRPAALPVTAPGGLEEDLARRDFTVNAMAVRLGGTRHGELTDLHGGLDDLGNRVLRVLHDRSFLDDPTRILRGVRFASRLGLSFASRTEALAREAVEAGTFDRLSGARWRHDLLPLLGMVEPPVERLRSLGILRSLHPELGASGSAKPRIERLRGALSLLPPNETWQAAGLAAPTRWRLHLTALAWDMDAAARRSLGRRLDLERADRDLLSGGPERAGRAAATLAAPVLSPHGVEEILRPLRAEELVFVAASGDAAAAQVRRGLKELLPFELTLRGGDLVRTGVPPGPEVGVVLRETRRARLDGRIGAAEELSHALALLATVAGERAG